MTLFTGVPYPKSFDKEVPVICEVTGSICKITPKAFEGNRTQYINPKQITIVTVANQQPSTFIYEQDEDKMKQFEATIERLLSSDIVKKYSDKNKHELVKNMCINLKNTVDYLKGKKFLHEIHFSWDNVQAANYGSSYHFYVIFDIPIAIPNQTAGLLTQAYNKYQKYKLRYNNMRAAMN